MTFPAEPCLTRPYSAKPDQKGDTLIAEEVVDRAEHRRLLADPDHYRPDCCGSCGHDRLHAHDFRERKVGEDQGGGFVELFRRFRCTRCGGVWMVLASFMARWLHRTWSVVQSAAVLVGLLEPTGAEYEVLVPDKTLRRWAARLLSGASVVTQALSEAVAGLSLSGQQTRARLVEDLAVAGWVPPERKVEAIAVWIHRLVPGIRLM